MQDIRPNFIDYARVIGIFLVILGHYAYALGFTFENIPLWNIEHLVTLFHMPLFFIISGLLFKPSDLATMWRKSYEQLILPYLLLCFIVFFVVTIFCSLTGTISLGYTVHYIIGIISANDALGYGFDAWTGSLWFCLALVLIKFICRWSLIGNKILKITLIGLSGGNFVHSV